MKDEHSAGFNVHTDGQDLVEENARERFGPRYGDPKDRAEALRHGWVDKNGNITREGWDILVQDLRRLEDNSVSWLRSKFVSVRDEGHDSYGDLIGAIWFDLDDPEQVHQLDMGLRERVDMSDSSYGDLAHSVWKGVSDFGQSVLGGAINFFDVPKQLAEEIEDRAWEQQKKRRRR
jgi:hypothetical protein